jgi:hypothetical protein
MGSAPAIKLVKALSHRARPGTAAIEIFPAGQKTASKIIGPPASVRRPRFDRCLHSRDVTTFATGEAKENDKAVTFAVLQVGRQLQLANELECDASTCPALAKGTGIVLRQPE